jgi:multiple sugar transport system ATP-binding protein
MRHQIKRLHQQLGTTIVYVTHDQIEAMTLADRIAVMRDGELQQLGTPAEIYNTPSNIFVAGFMGSPSMNFVRGFVEISAGTPQLALVGDDGGKSMLPLPIGMNLWDGKEVVMGIRPEHLLEGSESTNTSSSVKGLVEVLEPTGPDTIAMVRFFNQEVACRLSPDSQAKVGESVTLSIDLQKVVLFDGQSEQRIQLDG